MLANKVVQMFDDKVYNEIQRYLDRLERKSFKTRESYETDIKLYFKLMKGKDINQLNVEDVQLTLDDFEDYLSRLVQMENRKGRKYSNATINRKVTALKECLKYLATKKIVKDIGYFPLIESLKNNANSYDALKPEEVLAMAELSSQEKFNPREKRMLFYFALNTGLRKAEILSVRWADFVQNGETVIIRGLGKGAKEYKKYISRDFYNELLEIKGESEYVFSFSVTTVNKLFERLRDKMNFEESRRITFHSIRKASGSRIYLISGKDINIARKFLNHSNVNTTQLYMDDDSDEMLSSLCLVDNIDKELYKKVSHQELLKGIESLSSDQILLLNMKLKELSEK